MKEEMTRDRVKQMLATPVKNLDLSYRSCNSLSRRSIKTLQDILEHDFEKDRPRNFGVKSHRDLTILIEDTSLKYFGDKSTLHLGMSDLEIRKLKEEDKINVSVVLSSNSISKSSGKKIYFIEITHKDKEGTLTKLKPINAGTNIDRAEESLSEIQEVLNETGVKKGQISLVATQNILKLWKIIKLGEVGKTYMENYMGR